LWTKKHFDSFSVSKKESIRFSLKRPSNRYVFCLLSEEKKKNFKSVHEIQVVFFSGFVL